MGKVRAAFFDAAGVLYHRDASTEERVARLLAERGYATTLGDDAARRRGQLRESATLGQITADDCWSGVLVLHGVVDESERRSLVEKITGLADEIVPDAAARPVLGELRRRGLLVGVITDTMYGLARKRRWLERAGVAELVSVVACSTELGVRKPDPAIYGYALERAGLTAAESAFVGHAATELAGARAVGMRSVAVHPDPGADADVTVGSLRELLDLSLFQP